MFLKKWGTPILLPVLLVAGAIACRTADMFVAQAPTVTPTRTLRPTITPIPTETTQPSPTATTQPTSALTATRRPATPRPPTPKPAAPAPAPAPVQPTVSSMEFHTNPTVCQTVGQAVIGGKVYLDKNNPNSAYAGAVVALGPPDASTVYAPYQKADGNGNYSFVLADPGIAKPGNYGVWLVTPGGQRKSDIGIANLNDVTSGSSACSAAVIDFWK